jgi:hypothetical protein
MGQDTDGKGQGRTPVIAWTRTEAARHSQAGRRAWIGPAGALLILATFFYFLL